MTNSGDKPGSISRYLSAEALLSLGLFLLALLPRAYALDRFVTADEAKWVYRSAQFLAALLQGDYAATAVNPTPAVTTTWLGSLGLAGYYQLHQAAINQPLVEWLRSLPEFRAELPLLVATRWPMVVLTSLGVVAFYWLARLLFGSWLAFLAAALVALSPHLVSLSRILGHDAPAALFISLSLLLLLALKKISPSVPPQEGESGQISRAGESGESETARNSTLLPLILSGIAAGLAFLSKAPALFLIPFTALFLAILTWFGGASPGRAAKKFLGWAAVAYLTFVLFWPAAWLEPVGRPWSVFENAFMSATDFEEAEEEGYWLVPDLGPFYYVVNGGFKLSPLVLVGLGLAAWFAYSPVSPFANSSIRKFVLSPYFWLTAFILLFTLFMTLSTKRSPRYILPVFPPLALLAAWGWQALYQYATAAGSQGAGTQGRRDGGTQVADRRNPGSHVESHASRLTPYASRFAYAALLILSALLILLPFAPYYFSYYNPLLGGAATAQRLVKIGWGEGLDQVGRFLQRELPDRRVGTPYSSTVAPFYQGDLSSVTGAQLDYLVLYRKQVQSGSPSPDFIRYFQAQGAIFSVRLNGIDYADLYAGPALQPALAESLTPDAAGLSPTAFRPLTPYGRIGEPLQVDVVWPDGGAVGSAPVTVTLRPLSALDGAAASALAAGQGQPAANAAGLLVSRHDLPLPGDLERGEYALFAADWPLGAIELRRFQVPDRLGAVREVIFGDQIGLVGYQFQPTDAYIRVELAWQAQTGHLPDYTVFVQLLDAATQERLAGLDTQPQQGQWPTSRWLPGEVVVDTYDLTLPADLPPGYYLIIVGLYRPETGQRLPLDSGRDFWLLPYTFIWKG